MQIFVRRPVLATAINLVLLLMGIVAVLQLPLRHETFVPTTEIEITTFWEGANNTVIEQKITKPLEDALSGLDGISELNSSSKDNFSSIYVRFAAAKDYRQAVTAVNDKVQSTITLLPEGVKKPQIYERSQQSPAIIYIMFTDAKRTPAEIYDYLQRNVIDRLKIIDGIAQITEYGEKPYRIEVQVDSAKLANYGLTLQEIITILKREKSFAIGGELEAMVGNQPIILIAPFTVAADLANILLTNKDNIPIKLADVAEISVEHKPTELSLRIDDVPIIGLGIVTKPRANPLTVADQVKSFVADLQQQLPASMQAYISYDATKSFRFSIQTIFKSLAEAILLVGIIVTLTLASVRTAIVPLITIPLCLIGSFTFMWWLNFSINPITLLALTLAVGLVVDDAIVVVENIHQHMERGLKPLAAATAAMSEISFAVIVMTITLAAVYLPIAFQTDESAYKFKEFAWSLAGSVLISGVVALTLTPALSSRLLLNHHKTTTSTNSSTGAGATSSLTSTSIANYYKLFAQAIDRFWHKIRTGYQQLLTELFAHSGKVAILTLIVIAIAISDYLRLPTQYEPSEDAGILNGWFMSENQVGPAVEANWRQQLTQIINQYVPELDKLFIGQFREHHFWFMSLTPHNQRQRTASEIAQTLKEPLDNFSGPLVGVNTDYFHDGGSDSINVVINYNGELPILYASVDQIIDELATLPQVSYAYSNQVKQTMRYQINILREVAARLGVRIADIEETLHAYLSGTKVMDFSFAGRDYDVLVRTPKNMRSELAAINQFFVAGQHGEPVPLGNLIEIKPVLAPQAIHHNDRIRSAEIQINLNSGQSLDQAIATVQQVIKRHLPEQASFAFGSSTKKYTEARYAMLFSYCLAIAFIYLVLAALFESFVDPFIVLFTVPMAILGAVVAVKLLNGSNNIVTQIGMITLIGLITKHGILITDFANRKCQSGIPLLQAVTEAAASRLRPILMTSLAMVAGAIPLLFTVGAGANAQHHLGAVIIGGMITGTLFSLFVIPTVYVLFARLKKV